MATPQEWLDGLPRLSWLAGHGPCPHEGKRIYICLLGRQHSFCVDCGEGIDGGGECP